MYIHEKKRRKEARKEEKIETQQNTVLLDKGVQCNTFKNVLKDLEKELGVLYCEKEVREKEKEGVKVLQFGESTRGKPYDFKLREVVYTLRSHNVVINHIKPVINAVLSLVNFKILDIPCKSTNSILTTEMGV